jgi:motility quorum-sensing regulator / GCU-specific mRNA interferase toxin
MEKHIAHYQLDLIKALIGAGKVSATEAAKRGAASLDLQFSEMLKIVLALSKDDFYKSMTTHADHRIWQDVYRPRTPVGDVYLKLTIINDVLIVSFKEL